MMLHPRADTKTAGCTIGRVATIQQIEMPRQRKMNLLVIFVCLLIAGRVSHGQPSESAGHPQNKPAPQSKPHEGHVTEGDIATARLSNDYSDLEATRLELISEMYGQMYEISTLFTELERAEKLERLRNDTVQTRDSAKGSGNNEGLVTDLDDRIRDLDGHLADLRAGIPTLPTPSEAKGVEAERPRVAEDVRRILEGKVQDILKKTDELSNIGAKVTELNNTSYITQTFKQKISWIFASLVGLVIIGFFIVASRDDHVRRTIFSGDAGIQFLTLFSIVIAIILFGITGVLEGKEISALIGGISGYILGRSAANSAEKVAGITQEERRI